MDPRPFFSLQDLKEGNVTEKDLSVLSRDELVSLLMQAVVELRLLTAQGRGDYTWVTSGRPGHETDSQGADKLNDAADSVVNISASSISELVKTEVPDPSVSVDVASQQFLCHLEEAGSKPLLTTDAHLYTEDFTQIPCGSGISGPCKTEANIPMEDNSHLAQGVVTETLHTNEFESTCEQRKHHEEIKCKSRKRMRESSNSEVKQTTETSLSPYVVPWNSCIKEEDRDLSNKTDHCPTTCICVTKLSESSTRQSPNMLGQDISDSSQCVVDANLGKQTSSVSSSVSDSVDSCITSSPSQSVLSTAADTNGLNDRCTSSGDPQVTNRPDDWRVVKRLRESGQEYITRQGVVKTARKFKGLCGCKSWLTFCRYIKEQDLRDIFDHFWSLSWKEKRDFVCTLVDRKDIKSSQSRIPPRQHHHYYHLMIDGERKKVCRLMFMNTLDLGVKFIFTCLDKEDSPREERRKTISRKLQEKRFLIEEFLNKLSRFPNNERYIDPVFKSMSELHRAYVDKCKESGQEPLTYTTFREIFQKEKLILLTTKKKS